MIKTKITEMLGIQHPIICGAMMYLCKPELCAAISNTGGMGNLTAAMYETEEDFRGAISQIRELTDKPFMVSITMLPAFRITTEHYKMYFDVCAQEQIAGIEVSGLPVDKGVGVEYVEKCKKAGVKLFHKVGSVRHAKHAAKVGYDGIYAAGIEEGGHPLDDDVTTMLLTPRIVEEVDLPVVTVGGISNGISLAAALALGAEGVMMASRFLATKECQVHDNFKNELVRRQEYDTTLISKTLGLQARSLKNAAAAKVLELEARGATFEEIVAVISGDRMKEAWVTGDVDASPIGIGQSIGLIHDVPTCQELIDRMVKQAEEQIGKLNAKVH
ncbi:NAD(P)H-dependent flavin oxidoreductase [Thermodesulfobacteriota bacterium]